MQKRHESNVKKFHTKKSSINGVGLHTAKSFKANEFIAYIKGPRVRIDTFTPKVSKDTVNWIGASKHTWIDTTHSPFKHINHSCDPNCYIIGTRSVYALKDISAETELTIDYSLNETEEGWSISPCKCGAKKCRYTILPITKLDLRTFKEKEDIISKKFREIFFKSNNLLT